MKCRRMRLGRAEPGLVGDRCHGELGLLKQRARSFDPAARDPSGEALAGVGPEPSRQGPLAHVGMVGDVLQGQRLGDVLVHPLEHRRERVPVGSRVEAWRTAPDPRCDAAD